MNNPSPDLKITGAQRHTWTLALENMIDCAERDQPLHAIDLLRLKQLRDLFSTPAPAEPTGGAR